MKNKNLKHLFISMPMHGKTEEEILREWAKHVEKVKLLTHEDYYVIDNIAKSHVTKGENEERTRLKYLADSISIMADADLVYFAPGWEDAKGCKIEHECCKSYGIKTIISRREAKRRDNGT